MALDVHANSGRRSGIRVLVITGSVIVIFLGLLLIEKLWFTNRTGSIALRICVTGTRGKSSVTRLIAVVLRETGHNVLAKTTGSKPVLIYSDGTEKEIIRHGRPSILETRKVLKEAESQNAKAIVLEMMGILPESVFVESVRMIKPHILVITNVRHDHMAQMGSTKEEIASCFASAIPEDGDVFVLKEEMYSAYRSEAKLRKSRITAVESGSLQSLSRDSEGRDGPFEFSGNIHLALAASEHLGIPREKALRAIVHAVSDSSSLRVWTAKTDFGEQGWFFVNAFAANDPESTREIFSIAKVRTILEGRRIIGLLNLREDRGDRTLQWLDALERDEFPELDRFVFLGRHAYAARRRLKSIPKDRIQVWPGLSPAEIIHRLSQQEKNGAVLIGMGNIKGAGKAFVDLWEAKGCRYDV